METKLTLNQKLLEVQEEVGVIVKDSVASIITKTGARFDYNFFDINKILEILKPILNKKKIVLLQPLNGWSLKTIFLDTETNESLESEVTLPTNDDPQRMGAIITYFRRYSLQAFLSLETEDDDAQSAVPNPVQQVTAHIKKAPLPEFFENKTESLCIECGAILKLIPAGVSKASGKPYKAFYACPDKHKQF